MEHGMKRTLLLFRNLKQHPSRVHDRRPTALAAVLQLAMCLTVSDPS